MTGFREKNSNYQDTFFGCRPRRVDIVTIYLRSESDSDELSETVDFS